MNLLYTQVPESMKSLSQFLNLLTAAIGAAVNGMIQNLMVAEGWLPENLDDGKQEYLYFTIAAITAAMIPVFIHFSLSFQYKQRLPTS